MNKFVISEMLKLYRNTHGVSIRECSKEIGVSTATLSRIENGKDCDMKSLFKLLEWMMRTEVSANKQYVKRVAL